MAPRQNQHALLPPHAEGSVKPPQGASQSHGGVAKPWRYRSKEDRNRENRDYLMKQNRLLAERVKTAAENKRGCEFAAALEISKRRAPSLHERCQQWLLTLYDPHATHARQVQESVGKDGQYTSARLAERDNNRDPFSGLHRSISGSQTD